MKILCKAKDLIMARTLFVESVLVSDISELENRLTSLLFSYGNIGKICIHILLIFELWLNSRIGITEYNIGAPKPRYDLNRFYAHHNNNTSILFKLEHCA